ncbi:MAG: holo-ACP synthase [Clostridiales bacterium]|jgi:holo-[acyl-carrier protein] synthase|nr:holo-ACP synthase [Clostridiales bacterium]
MIYGVGVDIIEVERIGRACESERFLNCVFTSKEQENANKCMQSLAGFFAAKEAAAKALGTGFRNFAPLDAEILQDSLGKPYLKPSSKMKAIMDERSVTRVCISISHNRTQAIAFALMEA